MTMTKRAYRHDTAISTSVVGEAKLPGMKSVAAILCTQQLNLMQNIFRSPHLYQSCPTKFISSKYYVDYSAITSTAAFKRLLERSDLSDYLCYH